MKNIDLAKTAAKALLPFPATLRRIKRSLVPYTDNPANSGYCITQGLQQIAALREAGIGCTGDILEFGTGWLPLIPLLLHAAGARSVTLTDIERLMDEKTIALATHLVEQRIGELATVTGQPEPQLRDRLNAKPNFRYLVPWEAATHQAASLDLIISRAVFEHVPERRLKIFLGQFHRILRPQGAMCHIIDNSDHWEHHDKSLSRIDFLRYENGLRWKLANLNQQAFQNRLRHSDYESLFEQAGFSCVRSEGMPDAKCLQDLQTLPLCSQFAKRDRTDLAILTSLFVLRSEHF